MQFTNGPRKALMCLPTCAKCTDSDHPAHAQSITWAIALHSYILSCPMILLVDTEGPDQSDLGLPCPHMPKDTFHMALTKCG